MHRRHDSLASHNHDRDRAMKLTHARSRTSCRVPEVRCAEHPDGIAVSRRQARWPVRGRHPGERHTRVLDVSQAGDADRAGSSIGSAAVQVELVATMVSTIVGTAISMSISDENQSYQSSNRIGLILRSSRSIYTHIHTYTRSLSYTRSITPISIEIDLDHNISCSLARSRAHTFPSPYLT